MTPLLLNLLQLAVVLGVPVLIAVFAPKRWRLWAILLWALAPLVALVGIGVSEIATGKSTAADLDKLIFGLMLISSVLLIPWLIACGVGYGLGAWLRGRLRGEATKPAPGIAKPAVVQTEAIAVAPLVVDLVAYTPPVETDAPSLSPPGGWQAAHVGFDHDDLTLDGLAVWTLTWRRESDERVMLAHPAHPSEHHGFTIYSVDDGARAVRFAAAELSNGVWGFYRWVVPADAVAGVSADRSLRYEHDLGSVEHGRYDATAPMARIYAAPSNRLLFDGVAWRSSRVVPQSDGAWLLVLEQGELQTIFHLDTAASVFHDLTIPAGRRPLTDLAATAAAARAACDEPGKAYLGRSVAPDGSIMVDLQSVEWSNSHWVRSPRVTQIATGRVLLDLWGTDWDASVSFPRGRATRLSLRRYHFGGGAEVEIELSPERYVLLEGAGASFGSLGELPEALERASRRSAATAPARPIVAAPKVTARSWIVALVILAGAAGAIAVATLVTLRVQTEPAPQTLDVIPAMPGAAPGADRGL